MLRPNTPKIEKIEEQKVSEIVECVDDKPVAVYAEDESETGIERITSE